MIRKHLVIASMLALTLVFCASAAWALTAAYEIDAGTSVPATVSYLLNKDATSVLIEVVPVDSVSGAQTGPAVYSWSFASPAAQCTKGMHNNVVTWYGQNSTAMAPAGKYRIKITAAGAQVTDPANPGKLLPIWESVPLPTDPNYGTNSNAGWRVLNIAVNTNQKSKFFGRVYVGNYDTATNTPNPIRAKAVHEFLADGTEVPSAFDTLPTNGTSSPWGIAIDGDDHIYVSDRTNGCVYRYSHNGTKWVIDSSKITGIITGRGMACYGSDGNLQLVHVDGETNAPPQSVISTAQGDPPASFTSTAKMTADDFSQPAMDSTGNIYIASPLTGSDQKTLGAVTRYVFSTTPPTSPASRNDKLSRATGLAISPGNEVDPTAYMWLARPSTMYTDSRDGTDATGTYIVKFPLNQYETVNPYAVSGSPFVDPAQPNLKAFGLKTGFRTDIATDFWSNGLAKYVTGTLQPLHIAADYNGNLALVGGELNWAGPGFFFGIYEEQTSGPTTAKSLSWRSMDWPGDYTPQYLSGTSDKVSLPCNGTTTATISVSAKDLSSGPTNPGGSDDIKEARIYCPAMGLTDPGNPSLGVLMTHTSYNVTTQTCTFTKQISASTTTPTGPNTLDIYIYDLHNGVQAGHGQILITVTGGEITGIVKDSVRGEPVPNVTVQASKDGTAYNWTAITGPDGRYSIDATPGAGYTVNLVTNAEGRTLPTEYNPAADPVPPATIGTSDWPKTANVTLNNTTTLADGTVYPLQCQQVFYHWGNKTTTGDDPMRYLNGGRSVCTMGIVLRPAADASTSAKGYNGYYWIYDTRYSGVQCAVKVKVRLDDPVYKMGDSLFIVGNYDVSQGWRYGAITPTVDPVKLAENQTLPLARPMPAAKSSLDNSLLGGFYGTIKERTPPDTPAMAGDLHTDQGWFEIMLATNTTNSTKVPYRMQFDTQATTGASYPTAKYSVYVQGILDEYLAWDPNTCLKPGIPTDVVAVPPIPVANSLSEIKDKTQGTMIIAKGKRITAVAEIGARLNGLPADCVYIEEANRTAGVRVHKTGFLETAKVGIGDVINVEGTVEFTAAGEPYIEADNAFDPTVAFVRTGVNPRPLDAVVMNARAASTIQARGLFAKMVGKVEAAAGSESFILNDGGIAVPVYCGAIAPPATGSNVKIRGILSSDGANKASLLVRDAIDIANATDLVQPLPLPGYYKYLRDYLIIGPFKDPAVIMPLDRYASDPVNAPLVLDKCHKCDALMATDFIQTATNGAMTEGDLQPNLGETLTNMAGETLSWHRTDGASDSININANLPGAGDKELTVAYLVAYIYSPTFDDLADMTMGGDDYFRVYINNSYYGMGTQIFENDVLQGTAYSKYSRVSGNAGMTLMPGLNTIVVKVVNGGTGFGFCANITRNGSWTPPNPPAPTVYWGNGTPLQNLGYYINKP